MRLLGIQCAIPFLGGGVTRSFVHGPSHAERQGLVIPAFAEDDGQREEMRKDEKRRMSVFADIQSACRQVHFNGCLRISQHGLERTQARQERSGLRVPMRYPV